MSYFAVLGSVMAIHLAAVISPGPNFLIVTQMSIRDSRYSGLFSAWGVALASVIWSSAALVGVSVLFETATWLYIALKLLGGAYLVYLGIQGWRNANRPLISNVEELARPPSKWRAFRMGFITNLTNPKAVIFLEVSLLPYFRPLYLRGYGALQSASFFSMPFAGTCSWPWFSRHEKCNTSTRKQNAILTGPWVASWPYWGCG